eukprot:767734-Hanusia_phi.AAC.11
MSDLPRNFAEKNKPSLQTCGSRVQDGNATNSDLSSARPVFIQIVSETSKKLVKIMNSKMQPQKPSCASIVAIYSDFREEDQNNNIYENCWELCPVYAKHAMIYPIVLSLLPLLPLHSTACPLLRRMQFMQPRRKTWAEIRESHGKPGPMFGGGGGILRSCMLGPELALPPVRGCRSRVSSP